jgi:fructosamine-3-kinase
MAKTTHRAPAGSLLQASEVPGYLEARGLLPPGSSAVVSSLGGGVSNAVFAVRSPHANLVLKQALPQLRVADTWEADPSRALREAQALRLLHGLTPDTVPECLDADDERFVLVMPHAPQDWVDWKSQLLDGDGLANTPSRLGRLLATWQVATRSGVDGLLQDRTAFEQLRVDPYYRTVMSRRPDLTEPIGLHMDGMLATQTCLVHGDFSPKNVLTGPGGMWVIDMEVAHVGDPAFDVAFLVSHLILKSIRRPSATAGYRAAVECFISSYRTHAAEHAPPLTRVSAHVGCLLLARVIGKSPVEYLDASQQHQAVGIGQALVRQPPSHVAGLWATLEEGLRG